MEYKHLNIFLLFTITILLVMSFLLNNDLSSFSNKETFDDHIEKTDINKEDTIPTGSPNFSEENDKINKLASSPDNNVLQENNINDGKNWDAMTQALKNSESLCEEINNMAENKRLLKQYKENNRVLMLLDDQKKRISELTNVVNYLRKEKVKRQNIVNKCRVDNQEQINKDYEIVKKVTDLDLIDKPLNLKLGLTDDLKQDLYDRIYEKTRSESLDPPTIDNNKYIESDKVDQCDGCDGDVLKQTDLHEFEK